MPVSDEQFATLSAQLAGRFDEHKRLLDGLDPIAARTGYSALVSAAFSVAVDRRFAEDGGVGRVVEFVSDVRARSEATAQIDPRTAERVILAVYTNEQIDDIDPRTSFETQLVLLAALIADAGYDAPALDEFLAEARQVADQWLA
jgi:CelD/BcsL family acetyltransferase involved in cellulose biosynthesis